MTSVKDKIRKLLALARDKSASENEVSVAMAMATKLMMDHGIEEKDVEVSIGFGDMLEVDKRWHTFAANAAGVLLGTIPVCYRGANGLVGIKFTGRQDNVDGSVMVYEFIVEQIERLYKSALPKGMTKSDRAEFRRTFKEMCAVRVFHRAKEIVDAIAKGSDSRALVVVDHRKQLASEAQDFLNKDGRVRESSRAVRMKPGRGSRAGYMAGDLVDLQKTVD